MSSKGKWSDTLLKGRSQFKIISQNYYLSHNSNLLDVNDVLAFTSILFSVIYLELEKIYEDA